MALLVLSACANLGELECQGAACSDASAIDAGAEGSVSDTGTPGVLCLPGPSCNAPTQECCLAASGSTRCVPANSGGCAQGSDIYCDDPGQCSGHGATCWICISGQGFQGTSCNFQGDIVGNWGCTTQNALPLCHSTSQCATGKTCQPLAVPELDAGSGMTWFYACQ